MALAACSACSSKANGAAVYECKVNGQRIFSDQRCSEDATQREISTPNGMTAPKVTTSKSSAPVARRQSSDSSSDTDKRRETCRKIRQQIDDVHSHMRTGYTAAQGERLNQRLRKLNERYAQQRCERVHD
jgi:hypothetical protein